jgi:uncharacterized repeat protein (TIGR01451 family)
MFDNRSVLPALAVLLALGHLLLLAQESGLSHAVADSGQTTETAQVSRLETDADGLHFTLNTPGLRFHDGGVVEADGLDDWTETIGAPRLPVYTTYLILPPEAEVEVQVQEAGLRWHSMPEVQAVPRGVVAMDHLDQGLALPASGTRVTTVAEPDPAIYENDALYPATPYAVSEPLYYRDIRLVRLSLYPLRYNPVRESLLHSEQMNVRVRFVGGRQYDWQPAPALGNTFGQIVASLALNAEQAAGWRSLPPRANQPASTLAVGVEFFKIEVETDGIYELSYEDLAAAGMDVENIDPRTFEMLYRGEPVAYEFVGNVDDSFQPGEKVRFFGWQYVGHRLDSQFIRHNVFWLRSGGTPTYVEQIASENGYPPAESFTERITRAPEIVYFGSNTDQWHLFPNEPDAWYWDYFVKPAGAPPTRTYTVTLPYPALSGPDATFTAEFLSQAHPVVGGVPQPHTVHVYMNLEPNYGSHSWFDRQNVDISSTVPLTSVLHGDNNFQVVLATNASPSNILLNEIRVEYARQFKAVADELLFSDDVGGAREFQVKEFSQNNPAGALVWNVTNPRQPVRIGLTAANISGSNPYIYTFGSSHDAGARFIVSAAPRTPVVSRYVAPPLAPPTGEATWLAISHGDFLTETQRLAQHRAQPQFGGHKVHVVDIEDVINQYGYGLPLPAAIRAFLTDALYDWPVAPTYVLLVGDASVDPKQQRQSWFNLQRQYLLTDLVFRDRYMGQMPSDNALVHLIGDDPLPDMAIGRVAVQTAAQAAAVFDKIIRYEENHLQPAGWMQNIVYVSDKDHTAGKFCTLNAAAADNYLPESFAAAQLCLPSAATSSDAAVLRQELFDLTNNTGASFWNYRGHGAINAWASGPTILSADPSTGHTNLWANNDQPVVILSMDCLDGHFASPPTQGLGETFLRADNGGSAAHWSSSGLGLSSEHTVLQDNFYRGFFDLGHTAIGDAVHYALLRYAQAGNHPSNLYSFVLQGDPAMQLMRPDLKLAMSARPTMVTAGDQVDFVLTVENHGLYPALTSVSATLPPALSFVSVASTVATTTAIQNQVVNFTLDYDELPNRGIPWGATAVITMTTRVQESFGGGSLTVQAAAGSPGLEIVPGDENAAASILVLVPGELQHIFLPAVVRP